MQLCFLLQPSFAAAERVFIECFI